MCPLYSSGRIPMYVAPIKISAMLTVIISSSNENPRCFLDLIGLFFTGETARRSKTIFSCSATNPESRSTPRNNVRLPMAKLFLAITYRHYRRRDSWGRQNTNVQFGIGRSSYHFRAIDRVIALPSRKLMTGGDSGHAPSRTVQELKSGTSVHLFS